MNHFKSWQRIRRRRLLYERLENRWLLASNWRNPVDALDVNGDRLIAPNDVLIPINDLNVNGARGLPDDRPNGSAPPFLDVNGDALVTPADVLRIINAINSKSVAPYVLAEGPGLFDQKVVVIGTNQEQGSRTYRFQVDAAFDISDDSSVLEDTLVVYVFEPGESSSTVLDRGEVGTSIFSLSGDSADYVAGLVRFDGQFIDIDLTTVRHTESAQLVFQLLNTDDDIGSTVTIRPVSNRVDLDAFPAPAFRPAAGLASPGSATDLATLDETFDFQVIVDNIRYDPDATEFRADVRLRNLGDAAGRNVVVEWIGLPAGVSVRNASGTSAAGNDYFTFFDAIPSGGLDHEAISDSIELIIDTPQQQRFSLGAQVLVGEGNRPPQFDVVEAITVLPGQTLSVPLEASDPDGDDLAFAIAGDARLPSGTVLEQDSLRLMPGLDDLGNYELTLIATDGAADSLQTVNVEVIADRITTTRVSGTVRNTDRESLADIPIELNGVTVSTNIDGSFEIPLAAVPSPDDALLVHGQRGRGDYPFVAERLSLLLEQEPIEGVDNQIVRPIFLPQLDIAQAVPIDPSRDTNVEVGLASGDRVSLFVTAGSLLDLNGDRFDGMLSITEVPVERTPAALPESLNPDLVVTIQPGDMAFAVPAPITFPNRSGLEPGTITDLYSINPVTGAFDLAGTGRVSQDGSVVETIRGGVRNSSWHFIVRSRDNPVDPGDNERNQTIEQCQTCEAAVEMTSSVSLHSGELTETHSLVTYQSVEQSRGVRLVYDSGRADPRPILHFGFRNTTPTPDDRMVARVAVRRGDLEFQVPGYTGQTAQGTQGGEHFWRLPTTGGDVDAALQMDMRMMPTGRYAYDQSTGILRLRNGILTGTMRNHSSNFTVVNSTSSPLGAGWGIADLYQLIENPDGSLLIVDGDGSELLYEPPQQSGMPYRSSDGDFSIVARQGDGTFTRVRPSQTLETFDRDGRLVSVGDQNNNVIAYFYDGSGRLETIRDPVGLETRFQYSDDGVIQITDPAERVTILERDREGNLARITDPDGTSRQFTYDSKHHLTAEIDKRGHREETFYSFAGRVTHSRLKDGSERHVVPVQTQGLFPPETTNDPFSPPFAQEDGRVLSLVVDENGHTREVELNQDGHSRGGRDIEGDTGRSEYNSRNLLTSVTDARGNTTFFRYDQRGNITSIIDPESFVAPVSGSIDTPGQVDRYDFTVTDTTPGFYFDALTESANLAWSLRDVYGTTVVPSAGFRDSIVTPPVASGDYTLSVSGIDDGLGPYRFRLANLRAAVPIDLGASIPGRLDLPTETDVFQFESRAGDELFFDMVLPNPVNASWRLLDPLGRSVFQQSVNDDAQVVTTANGLYTLLVEGAIENQQAAPYRFTVHRAEPAVSPLQFGQVHEGNINHPGDRDIYTFTLDDYRLIYLDNLIRSNVHRFDLDGPSGSVLSNFDFNFQEKFLPPWSLPPGEYRLSVYGLGDFSGTYPLRLLDLGRATRLEPNEMVSVSLDPAHQTRAFRLTANSGDLFDFLITARTAGPARTTWRLLDPDGDDVFNQTLDSDVLAVELDVTGSYTLLVEGDLFAGSEADFLAMEAQFRGNTSPQPVTGTPLTLGEATSGVVTAGQDDVYTFALTERTILYFDALANDNRLRWSLTGPGGDLVDDRSFTSNDRLLAEGPLPAGNYALKVRAVTGTPAYNFRLLDLATNSLDVSDRLGSDQQVQLQPGVATHAVRFDADAGTRLYFDSIDFTGVDGVNWRLLDGLGAVLFDSEFALDQPLVPIRNGGTHFLLFEFPPSAAQNGVLTFSIQPQIIEAASIRIDDPVVLAGSLATAGENDVFTFTLDRSTILSLDAHTVQEEITWTLAGPQGVLIDRAPFGSNSSVTEFASHRDKLLPLAAGDYELTVAAQESLRARERARTIDHYQFALSELTDSITVDLGEQVAGRLDPGSERQFYEFEAAAGDKLYLDESIGGPRIRYVLLDSHLEELLSGSGDQPPVDGRTPLANRAFEIPADGTYTLLVEGNRRDESYGFEFRLSSQRQSSMPLRLGDRVEGSIDQAAEIDYYTFTLAEDDALYLDSLTNTPDLAITLERGSHTIIDQRPLSAEDFQQSPLFLNAGNYELAVHGSGGDDVNEYAFQLSSLYGGTGVTLGETHRDGWLVGNETLIYAFDANAGDVLRADFQLSDAVEFQPRWRLFDPFGGQVFDEPIAATTDLGPITLTDGGTFALLAEGSARQTAGAAFEFTVRQVGTSPPAGNDQGVTLELGQTIEGNLAAGSQDEYRFTLDRASELYFDALSDDLNLHWSLTGPTGVIVDGASFAFRVQDFSRDRLDLRAGKYTLTVQRVGAEAGPYAFRLAHLFDGEPILPGETIAGRLDPSLETDFYLLEATAGQQFYFDSALPSGDFAARLIDPFGQNVFLSRFFGDVAEVVTEFTGKHALLVEGTVGGSEFDYEFTMVPVQETTTAIAVPAVVGERLEYDPVFDVPIAVMDSLGHKTLRELDDRGNVIRETKVIGLLGGDDDITTTATYTPRGLADTSTDALGRITQFEYDSRGLLTNVTFALGTAGEAALGFEYDVAGNQTVTIDENGQRTVFDVDALNRPTRQTDPDPDGDDPLSSPVKSIAYDQSGNVIRVTDARGNVTLQEYDALDRPIRVTDARGGETEFAYDRAGNLISVRDAEGRTTRHSYNARNLLVVTEDAAGGRTRYEYDADDNPVTTIDARGNRVDFVFDSRNRLVERMDALGNGAVRQYDSANNIIARVDQNGARFSFSYDELDRLTAVNDALGNTTHYEYDAGEHLIAIIDALGRRTEMEHDVRSRLRVVRDAGGGERSYEYDSTGNLLSATDPLGETTQFQYDHLHRLTSTIDALGNETTLQYDSNGNIVSRGDAQARAIGFQYDELDRQVAVTDPLGQTTRYVFDQVDNLVAVANPSGSRFELEYDALDRVVVRRDAQGKETELVYDAVGNLIADIDPLGNRAEFVYDSLDRLVANSDPLGRQTQYEYDEIGNVTALVDSLGNRTQYEFDLLRRVIRETNPAGTTRSWEYDAVGNLRFGTDRNGRSRQFEYDALNRMVTERWLDSEGSTAREFSFRYDVAGQMIAASDPDSSYSFIHDAVGRLVSVSNQGTPFVPEVLLSYTYDGVGNFLSIMEVIDGEQAAETRFRYDDRNRTSRITQSGPRVSEKRVDLFYNELGLLESLDRYSNLAGTQSVASSTYRYDSVNRLSQISHSNAFDTVLNSYDYEYDSAGRIQSVVDIDGISEYEYDPLGQLLAVTNTTAPNGVVRPNESYAFDANGNRSSSHQNGESYKTGEANRLLSDGSFNYEYDAEGNMNRRTELATGATTAYDYDHRNRLVRITDRPGLDQPASQQIEFTYDVLDRRIVKTVDIDGSGPGSQRSTLFVFQGGDVWLEFEDRDGTAGSAAAELSRRYLFGPAVDFVLAQENIQTGEVLWHLGDHQGSVRDLIDNAGNLVDHFVYDSYGNLVGPSRVTLPTSRLYTGREFDVETGLYFYRARYYNPSTGRFVNEDPLGFSAGDTNLYRYVGNSVTNLTDPSGLDGDDGLESAQRVRDRLADERFDYELNLRISQILKRDAERFPPNMSKELLRATSLEAFQANNRRTVQALKDSYIGRTISAILNGDPFPTELWFNSHNVRRDNKLILQFVMQAGLDLLGAGLAARAAGNAGRVGKALAPLVDEADALVDCGRQARCVNTAVASARRGADDVVVACRRGADEFYDLTTEEGRRALQAVIDRNRRLKGAEILKRARERGDLSQDQLGFLEEKIDEIAAFALEEGSPTYEDVPTPFRLQQRYKWLPPSSNDEVIDLVKAGDIRPAGTPHPNPQARYGPMGGIFSDLKTERISSVVRPSDTTITRIAPNSAASADAAAGPVNLRELFGPTGTWRGK